MQIRSFRVTRATPADAGWLAKTLDRVSRPFGARVELTADGSLAVQPA